MRVHHLSLLALLAFLIGSAAPARAADEAAKLPPPPDAAALKAAMATVRDVFKDDLTGAKRPEEKAAAAKKLLQAGTDEQRDMAGKFALLSIARDLAGEGNDVATALAAVEQMQQAFAVDGLRMKADLLSARARAVRARDDRKAVSEQAQAVAENAMTADRYDVAGQMADVALVSARSADDPHLVRAAVLLVQRCREAQAGFAEIKPAVATLAQKPTDPDANLKVGRYYCFVRGDWVRGLPMLVLGSDPALKGLAEKELAGATSADDQLQLADSWWDVAAKLQLGPKATVQARAGRWYKEALPSLDKGLAKAKAEDRLKQAERAAGPLPADRPTGKWVPLVETVEDFQKHWVRGGGATSFDAKLKAVRVECAWLLGGVKYEKPWRELSFNIRVEKLSFGRLDVDIGPYRLRTGDAFKDRLPAEATIRVCYDEKAKQLYALVGDRRVAEVTVADETWSAKLLCRINSDGGQDARVVMGGFKVRAD